MRAHRSTTEKYRLLVVALRFGTIDVQLARTVQPHRSIYEIAKELFIPIGTVSDIVRRFLERGHVEA